MKAFFNKILSIALAFVVLFSTFSFSVEKHYCGVRLVSVSINKKGKGCGMEAPKKYLKPCTVEQKSCCKDQQITVEGQQELQNHNTLEIVDFAWVLPLQSNFTFVNNTLTKPYVTSFSSRPPPDKKSLRYLDFQQMLI